MATLSIDNGIYDRLLKRAEERQISVNALVTSILEQLAGNPVPAEQHDRAFAEWMEMAREHVETVPLYHVVDDDREGIYGASGGKPVTQYECKGKIAHDARIVASMSLRGVKHLLTFNSADFPRFPMIQVLDPSNEMLNS